MKTINIKLLVVIFLASCSKTTTNDKIISAEADSTNEGYNGASIYRNTDSDSLMIDSGIFVDLIDSFKQLGEVVLSKEYGGGDYYGKLKIIAYNQDTLVLDKNSSGEYGFGNAQYLIKNDSLILVRKYILESDYGNKHSIKESIFNFGDKTVNQLERSKTITGLKDLGFKDIAFDTLKGEATSQYQLLQHELRELLKSELIVD